MNRALRSVLGAGGAGPERVLMALEGNPRLAANLHVDRACACGASHLRLRPSLRGAPVLPSQSPIPAVAAADGGLNSKAQWGLGIRPLPRLPAGVGDAAAGVGVARGVFRHLAVGRSQVGHFGAQRGSDNSRSESAATFDFDEF